MPSYEVWIRARTPTAENRAKQMSIFHYRFNPIMRLQKFTKNNPCTLYYQDDLYKAEKSRQFHGDLSPIRLHTKTLRPREVVKLHDAGRDR